jgi:hypothetical protein
MRIIVLIGLAFFVSTAYGQKIDSTLRAPSTNPFILNIPDSSLFENVKDSVFSFYSQYEKTDTYIKKGKIKKVVVWNCGTGCKTTYRHRIIAIRKQTHKCKSKWAMNDPFIRSL